MTFDYDIFFAAYRDRFGTIKKSQTIFGIKAIIDANVKYEVNINQLSYLLATAYHETAFDFIPKYEYGTLQYFVKKYWLNSKVAKWLGNDDAKDAFDCRGRGFIQITGEDNYIKFGIRDNPDKAIELETATMILYRGCLEGLFTGKKLSDYIGDSVADFYSARRVVNGYDRADIIAIYAESFKKILIRSLLNK